MPNLIINIRSVLNQGTPPLVLPSGALGVWYADTYQSAPRPYIPNSAATGGLPLNLLTGTRRAVSAVGVNFFWSVTQATITDAAVTGPDGLTEASTLVASTTSWNMNRTITNLPAGTYTLAIYAKSNSGSSEVFRLQGSTTSATKTATTSWQRFTHTFTQASIGNLQIYLLNDSTVASLQFCDLELYAGSSDLGPEPAPVGHMFIGKDRYTNTGAYSGGVLDLTATGSFGFAQFPANLDISAGITVVSVAQKTAVSSGYVAALTQAAAFAQFSASLEHNSTKGFYFANANTYQESYADFWKFLAKGWHSFAHRYNGTDKSIWVDGGRMFSSVGTVTAPTLRDFIMSSIQDTTYGGGWKWGAVALFNRALTDAEVVQAKLALWARLASSSVSRSSIRVLISEGDSITASSNYPSIYATNANPNVFGGVYAVAGSTLTTFASRLPDLRKIKPAVPVAGSKYIISILITNGVGLTTPAAYLAELQGYCDTLRSEGWIVVLGTIPPRTDASHNTNRAVINPTLRSWVGTHCDAIFDIAADSVMGPDAAAANTALYSDGIHPTAAGQVNFEAIYRPVINAL